MTTGPLAGVKVVEFGSSLTAYCGKLFADLGAELHLVLSSDEISYKRQAPLDRRQHGTGESLSFLYYNSNKLLVELDLRTAEGCAQLEDLLKSADLLLESRSPGTSWAHGFDVSSLRSRFPRLVVCSITPFGQDGPFAKFEATDLTLLAMGGLLYMGGYVDTEPIRAGGGQAILAAGQFAAVASMMGLIASERDGVGDHIDVSAQECVVMALENAAQFYDLEGVVRRRTGGTKREAGTGVYDCADGQIFMLQPSGVGTSQFWAPLVRWLIDENVAGADNLLDPKWVSREWVVTPEAIAEFDSIFEVFAKAKKSEHLYQSALERRLPICPVNTPLDVLDDVHLRERKFLVKTQLSDGTPVEIPGSPYRLSKTQWSIRSLGPLPCNVGEEESVIHEEIADLSDCNERKLPLDGIRVCDFTWVGAGSYATKLLADHGAEVIKIESSIHPDSLRNAPPFKDGIKGINRSGYFADRNSSKQSVVLNLKHPEGRSLALRLIEQSDLVVNNFVPGTMERLKLGYDDVHAVNSLAVYVSLSTRGYGGRRSSEVGYGLTMSALSGLHHISGLGSRDPIGTGTNFPDHVPSPTHAVFAALAALWYRNHGGEGQFVDVSQAEGMIALLGPVILDAQLNGDPGRHGNRDTEDVPSGVYPCAGTDRWIAISVVNDDLWMKLVSVLGLSHRDEWRTACGRRADEDAVDAALAAVTRCHEADQLMFSLQQHDIAAGVVRDAESVVRVDEQLAHRHHWIRLVHPEMGATLYNAPPFRFASVKHDLPAIPAPLLGQHTNEVCERLLSLTSRQYADLVDLGVFA